MKSFAYITFKIVLMLLITCPAKSAEKVNENNFIYYPQAYNSFELNFAAGLSLTKLPTQIVEEEINSSPSIFLNSRLGLPLNFSIGFYFATNYISNIGTVSLQFNLDLGELNLAIGGSGSMWFGHVEMESIKLKSYGFLWKPLISLGFHVSKDVLLTSSLELQYGYMKTFSDDSLLAFFKQPNSNFVYRITVEQPLWNDNWVIWGVGLNFTNFYYQSWLSYNAIKDYLLYPEFYFGFIL